MAKKKIKQEIKTVINTGKDIKHNNDILPHLNSICVIILLAIFSLSLYFRAVMPYDSVFRGDIIAFASDDAVFHMRLVENTLHNFPNRIFYDTFTLYPYGSTIHFGPLMSQLIATFSLIAGMGNYDMQTVNTIGAFTPSIFGALIVFPVYYIGKCLGNRGTGLMAAFMIAILPGQFFSRSTLGFTDHHVLEAFFSVSTLAFYILAMKVGREQNIKFSEISLKNKTVLYSIFAGFMLAAFQLTWPGAPFFAMIVFIFILVQYIVEDVKDHSADYLAISTLPMFIIYLIFLIPYFNPGEGFGPTMYSWFHITVGLVGIGLPISLSIISNEIHKRGYKPYRYPLFLGGFFTLGLFCMKIVLPGMYGTIFSTIGGIFGKSAGGGATIAEASSIFDRPGMLFSNFPITGFLQTDNSVLLFVTIVLLFVTYKIIKTQKPEYALFLIWSSIILLAMYGQNRWAYYFSINAALIVGYAGSLLSEKILGFGGWNRVIDLKHLKNIDSSRILSVIFVIILVFFFANPSFQTTSNISQWGGGEPSGGGFGEWYESLTWMRDNTPDPGVDYFGTYIRPENGNYPYPESAYGVMSWWDYGHVITYWAHRIPNANPFQAGIGGGSTHVPGASTFLTAKTEEEANKVLNDLEVNGNPGARYIVSNGYMAYQIMQVFGIWNEDYDYFTQIQTNNGPQIVPSKKYYENFEAKLHILDGNGLKNYRLVHESASNPNTMGGYQERWYKNIYNVLYGGNLVVEDSGVVKIIEHVKGATITGNAPADTTVTLTNTIVTNIGRRIPYTQTTTASNGTYSFTVPYSTTGPLAEIIDCTNCLFSGEKGNTQFDTKPAGPYTVAFGNISKQIDIKEQDVLDGGTVTLNLV